MLRYMQNSEPKDDRTNGISNNAGINADQGDSPKLPSQSGIYQQPTHMMSEPLPLSARQQLAEAARIPVPTPIRGKTPSNQINGSMIALSSSPKKTDRRQEQRELHFQSQPQRQPLQQTKSDPSDNRPPQHATELQQQIWEESSINSMFAESDITTTQQPPRQAVNPDRHGSPFVRQRAQNYYGPTKSSEMGNGEPAAARVSGDWGVTKMPPENITDNTVGRTDNLYMGRNHTGSLYRHVPVLDRSQHAPREAREATHRPSFERQFIEPFKDIRAASPERRTHQRSKSILTSDRPVLAGGSIGPDRSLGYQQAVLSDDIDEPLGRTPSRPDADEDSDFDSHFDEAANQRTPRQDDLPSPNSELRRPQTAVPQKRVLERNSLPHVGGGGGGRRGKQQDRKRRYSLDYDDSLLHSMSYSELRDEPFDHDPARIVGRAPAVPAKLSVEDRLMHFQSKDADSQQQFFKEMPVHEWDECGDWFLAQFAELSNRIREKRQTRRRRMAEFEAEISEREKTVRLKAESIERTLGDLRHEGEGMMRGKVVDL
ncbi:hypothetical protein SEPCBS119000_003835 [Sporothrix epigloea]|uniref:Extracellular mutant protein 11 C-terminal domain-containing protein n=1 Tax=Sporothrix epigloea TaxID=1892477 RepID=A0ABP0DNT4_9PEZI